MSIKVKQSYGEKFKPLLRRIKDRAMNMTRNGERGIVNKEAKSSFSMRDDGSINMVSSTKAQQKLSSDGKSTGITAEDVSISNSKRIFADEIVINNHKLNPQLYELTDLKNVLGNDEAYVTGITLQSTVLVKAWEPSLERYVLIRRPARFAPFSPVTNTAEVHPGLGVTSDLSAEFSELLTVSAAARKFDELSEETTS